MEGSHKIFMSLDGLIIIQTGSSFYVYSADGNYTAFMSQEMFHNMAMVEIAKVPVQVWKKHQKNIKKLFAKKS